MTKPQEDQQQQQKQNLPPSSINFPQPLTLSADGIREVIDKEKAIALVDRWRNRIQTHQTDILKFKRVEDDNVPNGGSTQRCAIPLVHTIRLSNKSYTADAAKILASFLTEDGESSVASGTVVADLSDIIAGRMEEEGLVVLRTLCDSFKLSSLEEVDLSDNALGCKGISACSSVLDDQVGTLRRLKFCNNGLSESSMEEVADILTGGRKPKDVSQLSQSCAAANLTQLHFHSNMSGPGGCSSFARIIDSCTAALTDLRFSSTRALEEGSLIVASALKRMGDRIFNLRRLDLSDNTFGTTTSVAILADAIGLAPDLVRLNLSECSLGDEGLKEIVKSLWKTEAPLQYFNVSGNEITAEGAKALAEVLEESLGATVKELVVEDNDEIGGLGVGRIVRSLAGCDSSIEMLRLGFNCCGSVAVKALIHAYGIEGEGMKNLKSLHLDGNAFNESDILKLEEKFGAKLLPMEDNDEDGLSDEEEEDEEVVNEDDGKEDNGEDKEDCLVVDDLATALGKVVI